MNSALLRALALPAGAQLSQRISKKLLLEQLGSLKSCTSADKRLANTLLADLHWASALKPGTCALAPWHSNTHSYVEIAVLHASLHPSEPKAPLARLCQLIHRTIPYPVVLVVSQPTPSGPFETLSLAHKRLALGHNPSAAVVCELETNTPPLPQDSLHALLDKQSPNYSHQTPNSHTHKNIATYDDMTLTLVNFLQNLAISSPTAAAQRDLFARYDGWLCSIDALAAAQHTGHYTPSPTPQAAALRRGALQQSAQLDAQLASLRSQAAKETQLSRQVALHGSIQALMQARGTIAQYL